MKCLIVPLEEADEVSRETAERLECLTALIINWNPTIRLVGSACLDEIWTRHIQDSLQLRRFILLDAGNAADIGSGAGFPGLVLAIAMNRHFYLIESDQRKAAFLTEAARLTNATVTIVPQRTQALQMSFNLLTARAFASVTEILAATYHLLAPGAVVLLPKGRSAQIELEAARKNWSMTVEKFASVTSPDARILRISRISRA